MAEEMRETTRVLLAAGNVAGLEALRPTEEMLDRFGVEWARATGPEPVGPASVVRAVVVASPDGKLPGAYAATAGQPLVVRVPTADATYAGVALLADPATGDLPVAGVAPFATVAIGEAGAKNAALFVVSVLALEDPALWERWLAFRQHQTDAVLGAPPLSMD